MRDEVVRHQGVTAKPQRMPGPVRGWFHRHPSDTAVLPPPPPRRTLELRFTVLGYDREGRSMCRTYACEDAKTAHALGEAEGIKVTTVVKKPRGWE